MKRITRVISAIAGVMTSLFIGGCAKPASDGSGSNGLHESEYQNAAEGNTNKAAEVDNKQDNEVKPEFPESEEEPKKIYGPPEMLDGAPEPMMPPPPEPPAPIYGPPEMLNGDSRAIGTPNADGIPTTKYGPLIRDEMVALYGVPEVPVVPAVPPASPDNLVPELQDTEDDADSKAQKKDFETLKEINSHPQEGKKVYGPPAPRMR